MKTTTDTALADIDILCDRLANVSNSTAGQLVGLSSHLPLGKKEDVPILLALLAALIEVTGRANVAFPLAIKSAHARAGSSSLLLDKIKNHEASETLCAAARDSEEIFGARHAMVGRYILNGKCGTLTSRLLTNINAA